MPKLECATQDSMRGNLGEKERFDVNRHEPCVLILVWTPGTSNSLNYCPGQRLDIAKTGVMKE